MRKNGWGKTVQWMGLMLATVIMLLSCMTAALGEMAERASYTMDASFVTGQLYLFEYDPFFQEGQFVLEMPADVQLNDSESLSALLENQQMTRSDDGTTVRFELDEKAVQYMRETFELISMSPDCSVGIYSDRENFFAVSQGKIIVMQPDFQRGGGNREAFKFALEPKRFFNIGHQGMVWSPDNRYVVTGNYRETIQRFKGFPLILMDVWTGDIFSVTTFGLECLRDGAGVLSVCFDRSGRYLYYCGNGKYYEGGYALVRYDLETGEHVLCHTDKHYSHILGLFETSSGEFINTRCDFKKSGVGLNVFENVNGEYTDRIVLFSMTIGAHPLHMMFSPDTGWGLMHVRVYKSVYSFEGFIRFSEKDDFHDEQALWVINSSDTTRAYAIDMEQLEMLKELIERDETSPVMGIASIALSPDGRYAILYAGRNAVYSFYLLRLEDMALRKIVTPENLDFVMLGSLRTKEFEPGIIWHPDGSLSIIDEDERIGTYRLYLSI